MLRFRWSQVSCSSSLSSRPTLLTFHPQSTANKVAVQYAESLTRFSSELTKCQLSLNSIASAYPLARCWEQVAASGCFFEYQKKSLCAQWNILLLQGKWLQVAASGCKWLQVGLKKTHPACSMKAYTQKLLNTQTLLHRDVFTHRCFCTQKLLHTEAFTHKSISFTQTLLHTDAFTHRSFCTQALLHTEAFTHRRFYTQTLLHTTPFSHTDFYTPTSLRATGLPRTPKNRNFTSVFDTRSAYATKHPVAGSTRLLVMLLQ